MISDEFSNVIGFSEGYPVYEEMEKDFLDEHEMFIIQKPKNFYFSTSCFSKNAAKNYLRGSLYCQVFYDNTEDKRYIISKFFVSYNGGQNKPFYLTMYYPKQKEYVHFVDKEWYNKNWIGKSLKKILENSDKTVVLTNSNKIWDIAVNFRNFPIFADMRDLTETIKKRKICQELMEELTKIRETMLSGIIPISFKLLDLPNVEQADTVQNSTMIQE